MSLSQKCMLVDLTISRWSGFRTDQEASKTLTANASAQTDAAVVRKRLVPKETFVDVSSACHALMLHVKKHTLPWTDTGQRIMTRDIYDRFMTGYGELERGFYAAVKDFVYNKYPAARDQASFRMGDLFVATDYPAVNEVAEKFGVHLDIDGLTEPDDFRVTLPETALEKVKAGIEASIERRLSTATQDVWRRAAELLDHYIAKIGEPDAIFRDSTVFHLVELMNILPGLNLTNNPRLRSFRKQVMGTIGSYAPDDLRKDPELRAVAAQEARDLRASME